MSTIYTVYADDNLLYSQFADDRLILNPILTFELNKAGSFTFELPPENIYYNSLQQLITTIKVHRVNDYRLDEEYIFFGLILKIETTFYKTKKVYCEGCLSWLTDYMVSPRTYTGTLANFMSQLLNEYNAQAKSNRRIEYGNCWLDKNISVNITEYTNLFDVLQEYFIDENGGHFPLSLYSNSVSLNYTNVFESVIEQDITFGENLLDYNDYIDMTEFYNRVIPIGKDGLKLNPEYLQNNNLVNTYGAITRVVKFDDVEDVNTLRSLGNMYLGKGVKQTITLSIKAIDLSLIKLNTEAFYVGASVRVVSPPHDIFDLFVCVRMKINLQNPSNNEYTFGDKVYSLIDKIQKKK